MLEFYTLRFLLSSAHAQIFVNLVISSIFSSISDRTVHNYVLKCLSHRLAQPHSHLLVLGNSLYKRVYLLKTPRNMALYSATELNKAERLRHCACFCSKFKMLASRFLAVNSFQKIKYLVIITKVLTEHNNWPKRKILLTNRLPNSKCDIILHYCWFSPDVTAAILVYSQQKNFDYFFSSGHQHGRYVYCLLCLLGLCENQGYVTISQSNCKC